MIMPATPADAATLIEIEALRQIADNLKRLNDRVDNQGNMLGDVRERVIRIEANKLDRTVEDLKSDVDMLKADKERRDGAVGLLEWMSKFGPWLLALGLGILAFMGFTRGN